MYLPDFDYHSPESLDEALSLLAGLGSGAKVLAGGTDQLQKMKQGDLAPEALVSLKGLDELKGINYVEGRGVVIGALSTQNDILYSEVLAKKYPSVSHAAKKMASNQIRHLGTVGGNIVNAVPSADLPPILIALGATITLASTSGKREMALEDFFVEPASSVIEEGEILTEVAIPDGGFTGSSYHKFGLRRSGALAVVGVAVSARVENGVIQEARIVCASSAPKVIRAPKAEEFITGKTSAPDTLAELQAIVESEVRPRDSIRGSAEYRRNLAGVLAKRALIDAVESGHGIHAED